MNERGASSLVERGTRLSFWLGLVLTCLISAEVTARLEDRMRLGIDLLAVPDHDRDLILHDELAIRGRPNGRFKRWRLNSFGFRGPEITLEPPGDCLRVMILGASETFGLYESDGKEYPAQLEARLRRVGCYEVVNAAVPGLALPGIARLWNGWAARFSPHVVVIYPTPAFYLGKGPPKVPGLPPTGAPATGPRWTTRILERARDVIDIPAFIQRRRVEWALAEASRSPDGRFSSVPVERLQKFHHDLDALTEAIHRDGAGVILLTHATGFGSPPGSEDEDALNAWHALVPRASSTNVLLDFEREAQRVTAQVAAERRAILVDAAAAMNGRRRWFASDLIHFNDGGADTLAGLLAEQIMGHRATRQGAASEEGSSEIARH